MKERIISTVGEARDTVMKPVHQWSAIAQGIAEGVRVLLGKTSPVPSKKTSTPQRDTPITLIHGDRPVAAH